MSIIACVMQYNEKGQNVKHKIERIKRRAKKHWRMEKQIEHDDKIIAFEMMCNTFCCFLPTV